MAAFATFLYTVPRVTALLHIVEDAEWDLCYVINNWHKAVNDNLLTEASVHIPFLIF